MSTATVNSHRDVEAIKQAAAGRWPEIIPALTSIPRELLDGKHRPCPLCGGTDRFRAFDDFAETGGVFCNRCHAAQNSNGISTLMWALGIDFRAAAKLLIDHLGVQNSNGRSTNGRAPRTTKKAASPMALTKGIGVFHYTDETAEALLATYGKAKPPISPRGVKQCGGRLVTWHGLRCIRLDGRAPIDSAVITAVVLLRLDGMLFPAAGKITARKTHTTKGSTNSWIVSGDMATADTILDMEGVTDLLAAVSAGLPAGWVAVTNTAGAKARGSLPRSWAKGKKVIVIGDADEPGREGTKWGAVAYHQTGTGQVLLGQLPYQTEKDHGKDLRDWLLEGHKLDELPTVEVTDDQVAEWSKSRTARRSADREIIIGTDESRVIDEAIAAFATCKNVYQRGGSLVQIVDGAKTPKGIARSEDAPRIATMRYPRIREHLADAATWKLPAGEGKFEIVHPPDWVVKGIDARGQWSRIRRLEAVVESPILRADGSVLQTPGYDPETGIYFRPQCTFPTISSTPTRDDAIRARDALLEVWEDFPFAADAHRAACLAGVLTPLARYAFHGPAPLVLVDANVRASGKSLQTDTTAIITTGRPMARMSLPRDDDETRKRITAIALAGEPQALIDNIGETFGSPSLDAALTATSWSDRILGQSAMASSIPLYVTWYATGNNIILAADTARRVVHVRLESPEENPEERSGFHHADLLEWVRRERPRLTAAAVTILAGYCAAGRPDQGLTPWGSFEGWSDLVRSAVVWVGMADPGASRTDLASTADREAVALRQLLSGWDEIDPGGHGVPIGDVLRELAERPDLYDGLRAALWELCPPKEGKSLNPRSIGSKLHHLRRRVVGGKYLDRRETNRGAAWLVRANSDSKGSSDSSHTLRTHAGAHTHARENTEATGNTVTTVPTVTDCDHADVAETPTHDGYLNRKCRTCGKNLGCQKMEPATP